MNVRSTAWALLFAVLTLLLPTFADAAPKLAILKVEGMVCNS